ncbi:hypothetical protein ACH4C6_36045 [Streptomyces sp. NPDC017943]|uniref:hypothetical protein n=1 Tax=Streptomyces sp. NPDC017943 TaxID=3365019 RepID=UPI0037995038
MDLAIRQALLSTCRIRVGAVLVAGSRVLAVGTNLRRNCPSIDFRHATFHAEETVLRKVRNAPRNSSVFVARVNRAGSPLLARPCPRCQMALAAAGVSRAYYTTNEQTVESLDIPTSMPNIHALVGATRRGCVTGA